MLSSTNKLATVVEDQPLENMDPLQADTRLYRYNWFTPQSGEVSQQVMEAPDNTQAEITTFADQEAGWMKDATGTFDPTFDAVETGDSSLAGFLGRPIVVDSTAWVVNSPLYYQINPWALFITHPAVAKKLANYELLRANLNVKVVISGTGFHYGRTLVSYNPLNGYDAVSTTRNFLDMDLIAASQRPCIFLNPTDNSGGQMKIPYFFLKNYMSLSKGDYNDMGVLDYKSFGNLQHANSGDDPVYITTYVWLSEVTLTMPTSINPDGPTTQSQVPDDDIYGPPFGMGGGSGPEVPPPPFQPQAGGRANPKRNNNKSNGNSKGKQKMNTGDEYGQGIISAPASAIAKAAGMLTSVPFIEPYARATQMVASKVGQVASIFGYSRPAVISDVVLQKPSPTGNLANVDASDAVNRLTLDSKQELTIDSRTVGLDGGDQMTLESIFTRESYLTNFAMTTTDAPDKLLWNSYVTPNLFGILSSELHMTPMAMLAQYFSAWQGTIKFRFQVVKSNFHKGRILVRYDPRSLGATVDNATNYTRIIDLAEEDDFEIEIGWGQNEPFLGLQQANASRVYYGNSRLTTDSSALHNGVIELNVLNSLVSPGVDSNIRFNVFVSCGDDMKFGRPNPDKLRNLHYFPQTAPPLAFEPQSGSGESMDVSGTTGDTATDRPTQADPIDKIGCDVDDDHMMEVFFGEMPVSLREIFRRYVHTRSEVPAAPNAGDITITNWRTKALPPMTGDDPEGLDTKSDGLKYTCAQTHPLAFFLPCYAGWRGSLRHKWIFNGNSADSPIVQNYGFLGANGQQTFTHTYTNNLQLTKFLSAQRAKFSNGGAAMTNLGVNNTIETEIPFYQGNRFATARLIGADSQTCHSYQVSTVQITATGQTPSDQATYRNSIDRWDATGEDFTLFFWSGVPIMYNYNADENR